MQKPLLALKTRVRKVFQNSRTMYRTANSTELHDSERRFRTTHYVKYPLILLFAGSFTRKTYSDAKIIVKRQHVGRGLKIR